MNDDVIKQYSKEYPKRDVAVLGLRDVDDNVLLMRTHKLPDFWQPIGGGVDLEDASPKAAAVRELQEEFGMKLDPEILTDIITTPYDFGEGAVYFFDAKIDRDKTEFHVDSHEVIEYRWFSIEEALKLPAMSATQKYLQQLTNKKRRR